MKKLAIILLILLFAGIAVAKISIDLKLGVENFLFTPPPPASSDAVLWDASTDQVLWDASGDVVLWD